MKKAFYFTLLVLLVLFNQRVSARILIVDKSGLGQYTTIQAGINAALAGDTVKVDPGVYNEQLNISTNIVVEGSGYEYTQIVSNTDPAVSMSAGTIMWFGISSNTGRGVTMSGGTVTNCVVWNCPSTGVEVTGGTTAMLQNSDIVNNNSNNDGNGSSVYALGGTLTVLNTIVWSTSGSQYSAWVGYGGSGTYNLLYSDLGNRAYNLGTGGISSDPQFSSATDFTLSGGSPCIDAGKPDIYDPDGSRSDIGYYGGPNAPVFPVVTNLRIYFNPNGTVNVQATAQSRY